MKVLRTDTQDMEAMSQEAMMLQIVELEDCIKQLLTKLHDNKAQNAYYWAESHKDADYIRLQESEYMASEASKIVRDSIGISFQY